MAAGKGFDRWGGGPGQTSFVTAKNASMKAYAKKWPHATLSYGAFAQDFIRDSAKDAKQGKAPFCLSISFKAPHRPVDPDPKFDHVYAGKKFPKPANYGRAAGKHFSKQSAMGRQYMSGFGSWNYDKDYDGVMAKYHQQIYAIDVAVGHDRDALNEQGVADNTVIIYTSDNGFLCGSHGYGSKVLPYEEASRVPLLMFDPRHKNSGKRLRCDSLTGNVDFAPTILLELAGLSVPPNMDGRSLLKLYTDPEAETHAALPLINVWQGPKAVHSYAVVTKDWKYIYWPYAEGELEATDELYHLAKDRLELHNVIHESDAKAALTKMREAYDAAVASWKKQSFLPRLQPLRHHLRSHREMGRQTRGVFWTANASVDGLAFGYESSMTLAVWRISVQTGGNSSKARTWPLRCRCLSRCLQCARRKRPPRVPGPVKRFVCLSNNYGIYKNGFFPSAAGTDYALPPTLKPLERHRRDFTVFSNLDHGNTGGHQGVPVLLGGVRPHLATGFPEGNLSLDQKMAEHVGGNAVSFADGARE